MKNKTISSGIGIGKAIILKNQNIDYAHQTVEEAIAVYQSKKKSTIEFLHSLMLKHKKSDVLNF